MPRLAGNGATWNEIGIPPGVTQRSAEWWAVKGDEGTAELSGHLGEKTLEAMMESILLGDQPTNMMLASQATHGNYQT